MEKRHSAARLPAVRCPRFSVHAGPAPRKFSLIESIKPTMCSHLCPKRAITGQMRAYLTNWDQERGGRCVAQASTPARSGSAWLPEWLTLRGTAYSYFNDCNDCNNFIIFFFFSTILAPATRRLAHAGIRLFSLILAYSRLTAGKYLSPAGFLVVPPFRRLADPPFRRLSQTRHAPLVAPWKEFPQIARTAKSNTRPRSICCLEFGASLELGTWTLGASLSCTMVTMVTIIFLIFLTVPNEGGSGDGSTLVNRHRSPLGLVLGIWIFSGSWSLDAWNFVCAFSSVPTPNGSPVFSLFFPIDINL